MGGISRKKWILQAELFNELHRRVTADWQAIQREGASFEHYYALVCDFLKAAERVWGDAWGNQNSMVTRPVTIKAMIRVCADLSRKDAEPEEGRVHRWESRLAPWSELQRVFRADGFYERFPAKGQVERVARIHRHLAGAASIEPTRGGRRRRDQEA